MTKDIDSTQNVNKYYSPLVEQVKYHLTCAAEISEEAGLFLKTAEIKQVSSELCRMQSKDDDADKLDHSISELKKKARSRT